jgi:putative transposase
MAHVRRPYLAGQPVHVVHRGVNRGAVFFQDLDRHRYLEELRAVCSRYATNVHSYVLMDNHVHLMMTPTIDGSISEVIRDVCRRYVPAVNRRTDRCGTLWDGRHYSARVDTDRYVIACYRYIELNPVRAGIVRHPGAFPWSSYRRNAFGMPNHLITPHPTYLALGDGCEEAAAAYEALARDPNAPAMEILSATRLRAALQRRCSPPQATRT